MMQKDLTCRELVQLLTDFLEEALPEPEIHRFHGHMAECQGCAEHVEHMRVCIRITGRLTVESINPEVKARLLEAFRGWKTSR